MFVAVALLPSPADAQTMSDLRTHVGIEYSRHAEIIEETKARCGIPQDSYYIFDGYRGECVPLVKELISLSRRHHDARISLNSDTTPGRIKVGVFDVPKVNGQPAQYADGKSVEKKLSTYAMEVTPLLLDYNPLNAAFDKACNQVGSTGAEPTRVSAEAFSTPILQARKCMFEIVNSDASLHAGEPATFLSDASYLLGRIPVVTQIALGNN